MSSDIRELGEQVAAALHSSGGPTDEILATWVVAVSELLAPQAPVEAPQVAPDEPKPAVKHVAKPAAHHKPHKAPARHR